MTRVDLLNDWRICTRASRLPEEFFEIVRNFMAPTILSFFVGQISGISTLFRRWLLIFFLATISFAQASFSDDALETERRVRSAFIYQFTKLVEWPTKPGDFIISVIEDDELLAILTNTVADKTVGSRKIKVQSAKWAEVVLSPPDIVIFPKVESSFHKAVIKKLAGKPCLVVSYSEGLGAAGAAINFIIIDQKMKIEVNMGAAMANSLTVNQTIIKLGKRVD